MGKQARWSPAEDIACCRSYLRVSEDPLVGANQGKEVFEARVQVQFARLVPEEADAKQNEIRFARSGRSVVHRYKQIKTACMELDGKRRMVVAANLTGAPEDDVDGVTLMIYNGKGTLADA